MEDLGGRIRRLREERRWSQQQLGDLVGVSTKTVSNWERGRNIPRASLGALSRLFGVDIEGDSATDPVETAIRGSGLPGWRQSALIAEYQRHIHEASHETNTG